MANKKQLEASIKKIEVIMKRAQRNNAGTNQGISDGTAKTYSDMNKATLRYAFNKMGVSRVQDLTPAHTQAIIQEKINNGYSANNIRQTAHALEYLQKNAVLTGVFKDKHKVNITNHKQNLRMIKEQKIYRKAEDSHRYKAHREEALKVIEEMKKRNKVYADIARTQLLTGGRVTETARLKAADMDLEHDRITFRKAKGGLTNVVHINHLTSEEKAFLFTLREKAIDESLFRPKDKNGNYLSISKQVRKNVTALASKCANKLGIGNEEQTFSSHSFRGAFGYDRADSYARNTSKLDDIIKMKINEQPRLNKRYKDFEKRIKQKVKPSKRSFREIKDFEKIQWLVSTDLNHSRQDVVRYYVSANQIKELINKYK